MSEHVQSGLEDPYKVRVASEILDLISFYNTEAGSPHDIVRKMRIEDCWREAEVGQRVLNAIQEVVNI